MRFIVFSILTLFSGIVCAQQEKRAAVKGNSAYESENYDGAVEHYEQALDLKENYYEGGFNMGNALHRQAAQMAEKAKAAEDQELQKKLIEESGVLNKQAANRFEMMADEAQTKTDKAKAYHNMGNAKLMAGDIDGSIESYKQALRNNPDDNETRYNLAYAKQLKKQQEQQQQQNQDQNQDQEQDQEKEDDQEQQQDQENQDQQEQQDQEQKDQQNQQDQQEQKEGDEEQQQPQPNQLSHEDAQEMLKALQQEEDNVQDKLKKKKGRAVQIEIEQDW